MIKILLTLLLFTQITFSQITPIYMPIDPNLSNNANSAIQNLINTLAINFNCQPPSVPLYTTTSKYWAIYNAASNAMINAAKVKSVLNSRGSINGNNNYVRGDCNMVFGNNNNFGGNGNWVIVSGYSSPGVFDGVLIVNGYKIRMGNIAAIQYNPYIAISCIGREQVKNFLATSFINAQVFTV